MWFLSCSNTNNEVCPNKGIAALWRWWLQYQSPCLQTMERKANQTSMQCRPSLCVSWWKGNYISKICFNNFKLINTIYFNYNDTLKPDTKRHCHVAKIITPFKTTYSLSTTLISLNSSQTNLGMWFLIENISVPFAYTSHIYHDIILLIPIYNYTCA